ncbi:DNA phosphorothioation-associated putative methyltransferase [Chamaesiphon sp. VAR_48_metabat_135_sub]|uniref:DNA phosphorothioation-associated putative methyltransferase n=1 Tax=Chamaesiphon sp. VAR_48_metabat_135_sub TaxID=2964699 RepID=UPI00286C0281|nr:DNA phosphorothioation-associated putative methyltransferase [Chamaesiphon sp. VAR_48_metabat_135_sub]
MQIPIGLEVERHRAAMTRIELSRPVRLAIESGIITTETTIFDYGCGIGGDVQRLKSSGYNCEGWDPYYFPDVEIRSADIVNLSYIINVIEDPNERDRALIQAWQLTGQVLIVAAQILVNDLRGVLAYGDGILTKRNTFQKYYQQVELKEYIDRVLTVDAVPIGLGVFLVFRDEAQAETFRAVRLYTRMSTPCVRVESKRFEDYQEQLAPLMEFVSERGRIPVKGELDVEAELNQEFGSLKRAFQIILTATDEEEWDVIAYQRSLDLQVYLALAHFGKGRSIKKLSPSIRADIKAFFGSYDEACEVADRLLFKIGEPGIIKQACQQSKIGKLLPAALYVHISALNEIDPKLRLYEGCASRNIGGTEDANIIKFHTEKPCISYLYYPDFESIAHPALQWAMLIDLRDLSLRLRDYSQQENPPILHRKETFLSEHHPLYAKFAKFTKSEEKAGLFSETKTIGNRQGWERRLQECGVQIKNHRVIRNS